LVTAELDVPLLDAQGGQAPFAITSSADLPKSLSTQGVGTGTVAGLLGEDFKMIFRVLGIPINLSWVQDLLEPIFQTIANVLVDPVLRLFGVDLGLVRVQLIKIESSKPVLIQ
jgi:uncharacterized membrane protein